MSSDFSAVNLGIEKESVLEPKDDVTYAQVPISSITNTDDIYGKSSGLEQRLSINTVGSQHRLLHARDEGWASKTSLEKSLIVALTLVTFVALGLMIAVIVTGIELAKDDYKAPHRPEITTEYPPWVTTRPTTTGTTGLATIRPRPTTRPPGWNACNEGQCMEASVDMGRALNTSVNPCQDFYQFACGGWIQRNPIPDSQTTWSQLDIMAEQLTRDIRLILDSEISPSDPNPVKMAQAFYKACENQENDKDVLTELVTRLTTDFNPETETLLTSLGKIINEIGQSFIFQLFVELDERNSTNHVIYLDQPELGLNQVYWLTDVPDNLFVEAYKTLIRDVWGIVFPTEDKDNIAINVADFEKRLATIMTKAEQRQDPEALYNNMTVNDLSALTGNAVNLNWINFLRASFDGVLNPGDFSGSSQVIVKDVEFYKNMSSVLQNTPSDTILNYVRWRILLSFAYDTSSDLKHAFQKFGKIMNGAEYPVPRWKECADKTNSLLGMAVSYRYIQHRFPNVADFAEMEDKVNTTITFIKRAMNETLHNANWIVTNQTREAVQMKTNAITSFVGFPSWLTNDTDLTKYYEGLIIAPNDKHLQQLLVSIRWNNIRSLQKVKEPKDSSKWSSSPTFVNAFYDISYNSITLPLALLALPVYGQHEDLAALNFGAMGAIIGHEITHGFDVRGRHYDAQGNLGTWWDDETIQNYKNRTTCFQAQYGKYSVGNLTVNGENTLGENIADNGGLSQAFRAYRMYIQEFGEDKQLPNLPFTPQQLFYLSFAQMHCASYTAGRLRDEMLTSDHCPAQFRVRGVVENSEDFQNVWRCPVSNTTVTCQLF